VKVESLDANNAAKPLSTHRFNGLHWRIEKHWHAVADAADTPDRKTTFWYDAAWRVVQETQRDQTNGAGTLEESIIQQVWGARYIDDAVARMRVAGNGSGGVAAGASQELAFQLTDAQYSVIAVATPGKPGVVIDRIAYSPYGDATRTLRSDVNGDGFVNQSDHTGIIRPRNGAAIGTATYVVEADLDRNGVINQLDYDISIADDGKSSSGGVGEAGLFSRGVRNSIGYCGYIFNEDSGLYTVRFRTYSPTLGRWLERDPAGYVDGMGLYEYVRGGATSAVDPWGLWTDEQLEARYSRRETPTSSSRGQGNDDDESVVCIPVDENGFPLISWEGLGAGLGAELAYAGELRLRYLKEAALITGRFGCCDSPEAVAARSELQRKYEKSLSAIYDSLTRKARANAERVRKARELAAASAATPPGGSVRGANAGKTSRFWNGVGRCSRGGGYLLVCVSVYSEASRVWSVAPEHRAAAAAHAVGRIVGGGLGWAGGAWAGFKLGGLCGAWGGPVGIVILGTGGAIVGSIFGEAIVEELIGPDPASAESSRSGAGNTRTDCRGAPPTGSITPARHM
jgi:RHS repeat-associated protein